MSNESKLLYIVDPYSYYRHILNLGPVFAAKLKLVIGEP